MDEVSLYMVFCLVRGRLKRTLDAARGVRGMFREDGFVIASGGNACCEWDNTSGLIRKTDNGQGSQ